MKKRKPLKFDYGIRKKKQFNSSWILLALLILVLLVWVWAEHQPSKPWTAQDEKEYQEMMIQKSLDRQQRELEQERIDFFARQRLRNGE